MNRKYYFVLILVLGVSVLLLGLSYAKEVSNEKYTNEFETYDRNLKIVTSDNVKDIVLNDNVTREISVINKGSYKTTLVVELMAESLDGLSYAINDGEKEEIKDNIIYTHELDEYGASNDNDFVNLKVTIYSDKGEEEKISLIAHEQVNLLKDKIISSRNVYKDSEDNYRYYGTNVNNYAKYNGKTYRIVGLINNSILLMTENSNNSAYGNGEEYLTIADYLASFNIPEVKINNTNKYNTWLNGNYWFVNTLGDNNAYYLDNGVITNKNKNTSLKTKEVEKVYIDAEVILGDGSKNNPYEVVYDG